VDTDDVGDLLRRSASGDTAAFVALVERFKRLVHAVIRANGLDDAQGEDVFQVVFLRLYEHQGGIRDASALSAWLSKTARRECWRTRELARRAQPTGLVDDRLADERAPSPETRLLRDEYRRAVATAFAALPDRCRRLLVVLAADPPLSYDEVADTLGMPRGSIGPTRRRCLDKLRDHPVLRPFRPPDS
jgi:RNA polymerase sigma factor (sigma-70 family)